MKSPFATIASSLRPRRAKHWISLVLAALSWLLLAYTHTPEPARIIGILAFAAWAFPLADDSPCLRPVPFWCALLAWSMSYDMVTLWIVDFATPRRLLLISTTYGLYMFVYLLAVAWLRSPAASGERAAIQLLRARQGTALADQTLARRVLAGLLGCLTLAYIISLLINAGSPS